MEAAYGILRASVIRGNPMIYSFIDLQPQERWQRISYAMAELSKSVQIPEHQPLKIRSRYWSIAPLCSAISSTSKSKKNGINTI